VGEGRDELVLVRLLRGESSVTASGQGVPEVNGEAKQGKGEGRARGGRGWRACSGGDGGKKRCVGRQKTRFREIRAA